MEVSTLLFQLSFVIYLHERMREPMSTHL